MIKKFDTYNESVRDKMTPKSDNEIKNIIKKKIGIDSDYIEVKIPEPKEIKKVRSLLELSDEYNIDLKDNKDGNLLVCGYITDVFNFIKFYVDYTLMNKRNSREFYIDYIIHNISGIITESVRDKMTPKPKEEVEIAKYDIIQSIKRVVDANGGHITMSKIGVSKDDAPVYDETKTEDGIPIRHIITLLYKDDVKIAPYDNNTIRFLTLDWYRVDYEDLSPEIIIEIKSLLEEAIMWGNIYG